jgi:hypothetical protein
MTNVCLLHIASLLLIFLVGRLGWQRIQALSH